jgi:hypothetical protein
MANNALKNVKVGDRLWISYDNGRIICTVLKLTPTQVVTDWPWGKDVARFSRYDHEPHWRKIGYSWWYGSEIEAVATKAQCAEYDAKQEEIKAKAAAESEARQQREARRGELSALFGNRMVGVYEGHHIKGVEWTVHVSLTTQGVIKLAALLGALTVDELPGWEG